MSWVLDADIQGFFDATRRDWILCFLPHRIADRRILRLVAKWLKVGITEDGSVTRSSRGAPQGAVISPILANIYLHYVFDLWSHAWRQKKASGAVIIIRYADDIVLGFQYEREAYHPQTQGKIERWHQTLKNGILLENYYLPGDLEAQIEAFVEHYNHRRYHESLSNLTPADVYFGRGHAVLSAREEIKQRTLQQRRSQNLKPQAA